MELIELLKQEGLKEEAVEAVQDELEKFKAQVHEEAKDIRAKAFQDELRVQLEQKSAELEEAVDLKLEEIAQEAKEKQSELTSRVSVYLESKTEQLKQEALQRVVQENQDSDPANLLTKVASLVGGFYQESAEPESNEELEALRLENEEYKETASKLKLENVRSKKQIRLLEESLSVADEEGEVGGDLLEESSSEGELDTEDNENNADNAFDIVSLTAKTLRR